MTCLSGLELVQARARRISMSQGGRLPTILVVPPAILNRIGQELKSIGLECLNYRNYAMVPLWDRLDGLGERCVEVFADTACWLPEAEGRSAR